MGELIDEIALAESAPDEPAVAAAPPADDLRRADRFARDLGLPEALVADVLDALAGRGRALLVGPLAAGKTWLARRVALHVAGRDERVVFLRAHPALGYDDLVEARLPDGSLEPGAVLELCERARRERDARFVLVLDDVDRGDIVTALGELAAGLGERGAEVQLGRSRVKLSVPRNLLVLATARRAPADLLGRFPVIEVGPDPEALRRWLARTRPALAWVADVLGEVNRRLNRERGPEARVGHGLLMDPDLDHARLEGIWRREVLPLVRSLGLEAKEFDLGLLRGL